MLDTRAHNAKVFFIVPPEAPFLVFLCGAHEEKLSRAKFIPPPRILRIGEQIARWPANFNLKRDQHYG